MAAILGLAGLFGFVLLFLVGFLIVVGIAVALMYNSLVVARNRCENAWSQGETGYVYNYTGFNTSVTVQKTSAHAAILVQDDNRFTVKALTPLEDFNDYFGTDFDEEAFDTVGGLVIKHFGRLPANGDTVTIDGLEFKVLKADSRRVHLLEVRRL